MTIAQPSSFLPPHGRKHARYEDLTAPMHQLRMTLSTTELDDYEREYSQKWLKRIFTTCNDTSMLDQVADLLSMLSNGHQNSRQHGFIVSSVRSPLFNQDVHFRRNKSRQGTLHLLFREPAGRGQHHHWRVIHARCARYRISDVEFVCMAGKPSSRQSDEIPPMLVTWGHYGNESTRARKRNRSRWYCDLQKSASAGTSCAGFVE